jgi:5-methylcytosine-specific restriction enzyme subunit McrC
MAIINRGEITLKHLVVDEGTSRIPITREDKDDSLTMAEAKELREYLRTQKLEKPCFLWSLDSIKIINYVGFIQLSTVSIEILPKVSSHKNSREVLLNMLIVSRYLEINYSALAGLQLAKRNLFEIFGYIFALKLKQELFYGIYSTYQECENNLSFQKGKIVFPRQINNALKHIPKAYCNYHEFTADNDLNRMFKFVINLLLRKVETAKTLDLLRYCSLNFQDVSDITPNIIDADKVFFDRTNQRFSPAYSLAKIFLANCSTVATAGGYFSFSILFKMNDLFERYVSVIARKALSSYKVNLQHKEIKLLINEKNDKGVYWLKPDMVVESENSQLVIDTKWKIISSQYFRHGVTREDYFQMYAYLTRYMDAKAAILLYPYNESIATGPGAQLESYYLENNNNKKLKVYSISWDDNDKTAQEIIKIVRENKIEHT